MIGQLGEAPLVDQLGELPAEADQLTHGDVVWPRIGVELDAAGGAEQEPSCPRSVAPAGVGQSDRYLRQASPEFALCWGRGMPGVFQDFVGLERPDGVQ